MKGSVIKGLNCVLCGGAFTTWDKRTNKALGYKNETCEKCVCKEYDKTVAEFREIVERHFSMKPCMGL